jgi:glycosyltransferase involved in cell wall biosynthesis
MRLGAPHFGRAGRDNRQPTSIIEACAGTVGLLIHHSAALLRRIVPVGTVPDPARVAVLCDGFLRYGCAQAAGLSEIGMNVSLYYVDRLDEFAGNRHDRETHLDRARDAGVTTVVLPRRRLRSLHRHTLWLHRDLRRRRVAAAVVHAHIDPRYSTLGLSLPVALMVHDPQLHSGDELSRNSFSVRMMSRFAEMTAACLVIHSEKLLVQVRPVLRLLPIGVVPHGADMAAMPTPVPVRRRLLVFGRLFEYKGVDTALDAFCSLPSAISDTELVVAGRGPLAASAHGVPNVEVREGYVADADLEELLATTRLVLLAYKDATQSGVGLQAIARGVPCVVSRTGGLPELVDVGSPGLVVEPNSPTELAHAIAEHIDHGEPLRRATYEHAAANFAWPVVARRICAEMARMGLAVASPGDSLKAQVQES